ncbi:MAG: thioesterase family protein [Polaribacter sp.]|nr:thioesterase family protein [Polaribacter sp.]
MIPSKKQNKVIFKSTSFRVRYGETDQMGVVYHGNYAQFFEIGRIDWLRSLDISYKKMEENNIILPVISLQCNFKKSAEFDDEITVKTILKKIPSVKIEFEYEITNQKNELLTTGNTVLAFINAETKKPMRCPDSILKKLRF